MKTLILTLAMLLIFSVPAIAQVIRGGGNPYSSQLITDPDGAGTIHGIQQYGRPMAADPERGSGSPYHVFPTVRDPRLNRASPFTGRPSLPLNPFERLQVQRGAQQIEFLKSKLGEDAKKIGQSDAIIDGDGIAGRSYSIFSDDEVVANDLSSLMSSPVFIPGAYVPGGTRKVGYIPHQPLIQIKMRVVEVARSDDLAVASALDYISGSGSASKFPDAGTFPNVNSGLQNLTGVSRFDVAGLLDVSNIAAIPSVDGGVGAIVNVTSRHLNWIASALANELEADVLTAPELVTLDGQQVEFVAGSKSPFALGTVTPGADSPTQNNFFYKHIGTYVRVTPKIVNFGGNGEGKGEVPIVGSEVRNWNLLTSFLMNRGLILAAKVGPLLDPPIGNEVEAKKQLVKLLLPYTREKRLVPLGVRSTLLDIVNQFSREDLRIFAKEGKESVFKFDQMIQPCGDGCDWKPENCTIELDVLARFSSGGPDGIVKDIFNNPDIESDVRAIKNTLQIKNGTGLVMAGLIGESDVETVAKVPLIGDIPFLGSVFRAKTVTRKKFELLIFIEAKVLSQDPDIARAESADDLHLAAPYVFGGTLDNPLEVGLQRAGFGTYLPPPSDGEEQYWQRHARRVNRIMTTAHDAVQ